ncbi:MAG: hypothetical protein OEQ47_16195, partial [Acidimicrobiia bacterium]|nr:hypothetical protein [Acidimicrobiia bacterium]
MTLTDTSHLRRAVVFVALALMATLLPAAASAQTTDDTYVIEGSGWGHGVGMSQYGARALAAAGRSAAEIIGYYYTGVTLQDVGDVLGANSWMVTDPDPLWIGLSQNRSSLQFHMHDGA